MLANFDIEEDQKDPEDPSKLGAVLRLFETAYADLEEIIARFVEPIVILVESISHYSKYLELPDVFSPTK